MMKKLAGLVDIPSLHVPNMQQSFAEHNIEFVDIDTLSQLSQPEKKKSVVIIQDWVTSFYETPLVIKFYHLLEKLGYRVVVMPWFPNGKPLHVKGFLKRFKKVAEKNMQTLHAIADLGIPMLGVDPSMLLTFRYEYREMLGSERIHFKVHLVQEWLAQQICEHSLQLPILKTTSKKYKLLSHCTEKTAQSQSDLLWQTIFSHFGLTLTPVNTGCCGMAGTYGHEVVHQSESRRLFAMSWEAHIPDDAENDNIVVTGYSCRWQIRRLTSYSPKHPVEVLLKLI